MKIDDYNELEAVNLAGVYQEIAEIIGVKETKKIHDKLKGQQLLLPQRFYKKSYIVMKIKEEYDGKNVKQLAMKYEYTERRIRQLLKD